MSQLNEKPRIAVILSGGGGRRMGGADKGELMLGGRRLVDHVVARLAPQADVILISGRHDYGTGFTVLPDREDGPRGPAAGLWAALNWIEENFPDVKGFLSAPVDGPFLPSDLFERLFSRTFSTVACEDDRVHPTYSYWRCDALHGAFSFAEEGYGYPLRELADSVHAKRVMFDDVSAFLNINSPEDLARAEKLMCA